MESNEAQYIICQYCNPNTIIRFNEYIKHVSVVHNIVESVVDAENKAMEEKSFLEKLIRKGSVKGKSNLDMPKKKQKSEKNYFESIESGRRRKAAELWRKQEERKEFIKKNSRPYLFIWDEIYFEKDQLRIKTNRYKESFKPIAFKGSLPILNDIKKDYFVRLYNKPIKLLFFENELQPIFSPGWQTLIGMIENAIEYAEFRFSTKKRNRVGELTGLSNEELLKLYEPQIEKNVFIKFLANKLSSEFRIVPIVEFQNGQYGESFIFRIRSLSSKILVIWENSKSGRATHLFIADDRNMDKQLKKIESFIIATQNSKRILLRDFDGYAKNIKTQLLYIGSINHTTLNNYKMEIQSYYNRY